MGLFRVCGLGAGAIIVRTTVQSSFSRRPDIRRMHLEADMQ